MHLTHKTGLVLATLAALAAAVPAAAQTTLNFGSFTAGSAATGNQYVGTSYDTQGFTLASNVNFYAQNGSGPFGDGETSLYSNGGGSTTLTQDNGHAFTLDAIDLGPYAGNNDGTFYGGPVTFLGTRVGGGTVTVTENVTSAAYQTFIFTGFTHLTSLTFLGSGGSSRPLFDNVVLTPDAGAAPEPPQAAGLGVTAFGILGLLLRARRRLQCD